ncbi:uncharacterized protein B0H64DRAFT_369739 [Chaetomium fimeti]|uniref:Uncharacterized protein n=1 Tax=Chaetomium fimeti TaxID=1854472 RepID=A0AAE0HPV0_9PEZI|nr:hypothetical protein B0H64DRAFT_369739 [Chaetomium fimeti]
MKAGPRPNPEEPTISETTPVDNNPADTVESVAVANVFGRNWKTISGGTYGYLGSSPIIGFDPSNSKFQPFRTLRSKIGLALIYRGQGELVEAKDLGRQVTAHLFATLGHEHPATLASWNDLVWVYEKLGMLDAAEQDASIILRVSTEVLGGDHRLTLLASGNLASIYRCRGKLAEAAELGELVLFMRKTVLGKDHTDVLIAITDLALTYQKQGRYEDLRKLFRRGAGLDEEEPGPDLFARYGPGLLGSLTLAVISYAYWRHASK